MPSRLVEQSSTSLPPPRVNRAIHRRVFRAPDARQAEIEDLDLPVESDDDVAGFEVAMHQPAGVGRRQAAAGLCEHVEHLLPSALFGREPFAQRDARDQLHGEKQPAVDAADVVHRDDVGMRDPGHRARLALQPRPHVCGQRIGGHEQDLERDLAIELGIVGGIDDAHAAGTEVIEDDIATQRRAASERG